MPFVNVIFYIIFQVQIALEQYMLCNFGLLFILIDHCLLFKIVICFRTLFILHIKVLLNTSLMSNMEKIYFISADQLFFTNSLIIIKNMFYKFTIIHFHDAVPKIYHRYIPPEFSGQPTQVTLHNPGHSA